MTDQQPSKGELDHSKRTVTRLSSIQEQVGMHVIQSLQEENTAAVISTVMAGQDGSQNIVSVRLNQELLGKIEELLSHAHSQDMPRVPCVGFHCYLPDKDLKEKPSE